MKQTILIAFFSISILMIQACGEDEDLPTNAQASFEMKAVSNTSTLANGRVEAVGYTFTEVFAGVTEIEFETLEEEEEEEANGGESEDEEVEFEGNFVINLLTGTSDPDFGLAELLSGVYQEVEMEFDNILEGEKTIVVNFYFIAEGSTDTTFVEFSSAEELEIEIENEAGFVLDDSVVNLILVTLDLDILFGSIDYNTLAVDEDGVIRINEDSNSEFAHSIIESLEEALEAEEEEEDDEDDDESDEG